MALLIVSLLVLYFVLSQNIHINATLITAMGNVALLILFEFINLLVHNTLATLLEDMADDIPEFIRNINPIYIEFLFLVLFALFLIPLHHKLQSVTVDYLVKKNKEFKRKTKEVLDKEILD